MCGIAGFFSSFSQSQSEREAILAKMLSAISHRGPDADGLLAPASAPVALGHRRLSIIDLTPTGAQPMLSRSGRFSITFNGEIYNFQELRRELEANGASWRGTSDTEVMLEAFEQWGIKGALEHFVGMFAFAVWDQAKQELTIARDRLGEKPLYYGWHKKIFWFGSELKAIAAGVGDSLEISQDAMRLFLRFNCIPAPFSIYKGFFKLVPGSYWTIPVSLSGSTPSAFNPDPRTGNSGNGPQLYWNLNSIYLDGIKNPLSLSDNEAENELNRLLTQAVRSQMISDVPIGAFLSGGIDSSTIVALMQQASSSPVRTFSIGFHEQSFDEANHAKLVAQHLGTAHTELYISPRDAHEVIPHLAEIYDEPFADSSQIPTFLVAKLARQQVTVSLSGDGGDELFGGYNRYLLAGKLWNLSRATPGFIKSIVGQSIRSLPPERWDALLQSIRPFLPSLLQMNHLGDKLYKVAGLLGVKNDQELYLKMVSHWELDDKALVPTKSGALMAPQDHLLEKSIPFIHKMMLLDLLTYLPDDILVKVDRATMAVSLESRAPFLDHRIVEFSARLPLAHKVRGRTTKHVLRKVLERSIPKDLWDRPKMGFGMPVGTWLRGPLRDWCEELLSEKALTSSGILNPVEVRKRWRDHLEGRGNWQYLLWDVLMLQGWLKSRTSF